MVTGGAERGLGVAGWMVGLVVVALVIALVGGVVAVLRRPPGRPAAAGPTGGRAVGPPAGPPAGPVVGGGAPGPDGTRRDLRPVVPGSPAARPAGGVLPRDLVAPSGALTLLQLSSAFCSSCRDTRAVLADVAAEHPGVVHRDVDVAVRPELVRLLAVRSTPTTLLVDAHGVELLRVVGVPRRAAVAESLAPHLRRSDGPLGAA